MVAQAVVYGKSMGQLFGNLMRSMASQLVSMIVTATLRYIASMVIQSSAAIAELSIKMGAFAAETYGSAFSSSVGYLTPYGAAVYAAGAVGSMLAGAKASQAAGSGLFGQGHEGVSEISAGGTWILDRGERVLSNRQNRDLTEFLDGRGGGGSGPTQVVLTVDGRELGRVWADLYKAGRVPLRLAAA